MSYDKIELDGFDNKPVPFKDTVKYPQPKKKSNLPFNFFTALAIGSTGSGKSFSVSKLLKYYEKAKMYDTDKNIVPQRIIIFCPTYYSNPIYNSLKNLDEENDVYTTYSDTLLQEVLDDIKAVKKESQDYAEIMAAYKKFLKVKNLNQLTPEEMILLHKINFDLKYLTKPRYEIPPVNHLIFDDLISTNAYKSNGVSLLSNLAVRNRHLQCNLYFLAQSVKQLPKIIRVQARLLMIYRYNSKSIVDDLYEVVSGVLKPEEFEKIYFDASDLKYNFLTIDNTGSDLVLKQNFNYLIRLNSKKDKVDNEKIKTLNK